VTDPALAGSRVLAIHESRDGSLWIASRTSVFRRKAGATAFVLMDTFDIASNAWQGFSEDAEGRVWISDFREGFRRVGTKPSPDSPHRGWGVQLLHDRRGNFWVATRGRGCGGYGPDKNGEQSWSSSRASTVWRPTPCSASSRTAKATCGWAPGGAAAADAASRHPAHGPSDRAATALTPTAASGSATRVG
jgi:hypothetical protein